MTTEPIITGPGTYRTRDGQRIEIAGRNDNGVWHAGHPGLGSWTDGGAWGSYAAPHPRDIVGSWEGDGA